MSNQHKHDSCIIQNWVIRITFIVFYRNQRVHKKIGAMSKYTAAMFVCGLECLQIVNMVIIELWEIVQRQ